MKPFPSNPPDHTIFESSPGIYYEYSATSQTWTKLEGFNQFIDVATPIKNGLMSKEDYIKINGLLLPPPRTTLRSEQCNEDIIFKSGTFGFRSSNEDLIIDDSVSIFDNSEQKEEKIPFLIHENTYGISFKVNFDKLVQTLRDRGQIIYTRKIGQQGPQGPRGQPGRDKLDVGPIGENGENGKNAPWPGLLRKGNGQVDDGRAIVDISTEEISPDENYIVILRANVQNPAYCPNLVKPILQKSPWVLAMGETIKQNCIKTDDPCGQSISYCSSNLAHIDMTEIENEARTRFYDLLNQMKISKETVAKRWLDQMMASFYGVKHSLCCAIQNCKSKTENKEARERIDYLKILAGQVDKQLVVASMVDGRRFIRCAHTRGTPRGLERDYVAIIDLEAVLNNSEQNAAEFFLDPGQYLAEITNCCYKNVQTEEYDGAIMISVDGKIGRLTEHYQSKNQEAVRNEYMGKTYRFNTTTGNIKLWLAAGGMPTGAMQVSIYRSDNKGLIADNNKRNTKTFFCNMAREDIQKYQEAWNANKCIGACVQVDSMKWLVVMRPDDTSRGISEAIVAGFHPAIAFQTADCKRFMGVPRSTIRMIRDVNLETAILQKINEGKAIDVKGDPLGNIQGILFPYERSD